MGIADTLLGGLIDRVGESTLNELLALREAVDSALLSLAAGESGHAAKTLLTVASHEAVDEYYRVLNE
jgi:hypothetical protein